MSRDERRRVRLDLTRGGYLDVCLSPDASPETLDALRKLGEAALDRMLADEPDDRSDRPSKPARPPYT